MLLLPLLGLAQAALLTANLTLQVSSDNQVSLPLSDYVLGDNLTYSITGYYYNASGSRIPQTSQPLITQGMSLVWSRTKGPNFDVTAIVQDAANADVIYTVDDSIITAWNKSAFPVLTPIASLELNPQPMYVYPFTGVGSLGCVLLVSSAFYEKSQEESLFIQAACLNASSLQNYTNLFEPEPIFEVLQGVDFQLRAFQLYIYLIRQRENYEYVSFFVMPQDMSRSPVVLWELFPEDLGVEALSPVRFAGIGNIGVLCDPSRVFILNMTNITMKPPELRTFLGDINGIVLDCLVIDTTLLITTYEGVFNYTLLDEYPLLIVQASQPLAEYSSNLRGHFTQFNPVGQTLALYFGVFNHTTRPSFSFAVINAAAQDLRQAIVLEISTSALQDTEGDVFLPFLLIESDEHMYVIFDSPTCLLVYQIYRIPTLIFEPVIKGAYSYIGQVWTDSQAFPINVTALDIHSLALIQRDPLPPLKLIHYLGSSDSVYTDIYFPASDYLFGPNLTYDIGLISSSYPNVNKTIPPLLTYNESLTYSVSSPARVKTIDLETESFMAVLSNNSVLLYNCLGVNMTFSLLASLQPSQASFQATDFVFVILGSTSFKGLVIASTLNSTVVFDLFSLSKPQSPLLVNSLNRTMSPPQRMHGADGYVYALLPGEILMLVLLSSSSYNSPLVKFQVISAATIVSPKLGSFVPLDCTSSINSTLLWIYEQHLGLAYIQMTVGNSILELIVVNYTGGNEVTLAMQAISSWQWVFVVGGPAYQLVGLTPNITGNYQVTTVFPSLPYCTYTLPVTANVYIALLCTNQTSSQVLIFDTTSTLPNALVTAVWLPSPDVSITLSYVSASLYHLFTYDGQTLTRYLIGQFAEAWQPASQLFTNTLGTAVWARCTLNFAEPPNELEYTIELNLTASDSVGGFQSLIIELIVVNPGTFIITSSGNNTSPLVQGRPQLYTSLQEIPLPTSYFTGLDVSFSLYVNDGRMIPVNPSDFCDPSSYFVCLTDKSYVCEDCYDPFIESNIIAFLNDENKMMYFASEDLISAQAHYVLEDLLPLQFNISDMLNLTSSECYLLAHVQNYNLDSVNIVTAACFGQTQTNQTSSFLMFLNITEVTAEKAVQLLGFRVTMLAAAMCNGEILVFASDGANVYVYLLNGTEFEYYSKITAGSLSLTWLAPSSLQFVSDTLFVLGDQNNGVVLLRMEESNGQPVFTIAERLTMEFGDNSIVALRVYVKEQELYVLSRMGHVSLYDLSTSPAAFIRSINPVENGEFVPYTNTMDTDVNFNYVAYLVQIGGGLVVRVLDFTNPDWHSTVYTSVSTGVSSLPSTAYLQIIAPMDNLALQDSDTDSIQVAVLLLGALGYTTYVINFQTVLTVNKGSRIGNFSLQVVASNSMSKAEAPPFTVYFNDTDVDDGEIAKFTEKTHVYQRWWFWAAIGFGLIVTFTAISLLMIKYYHRGKPGEMRSTSIALTTTDRSSLLIS